MIFPGCPARLRRWCVRTAISVPASIRVTPPPRSGAGCRSRTSCSRRGRRCSYNATAETVGRQTPTQLGVQGRFVRFRPEAVLKVHVLFRNPNERDFQHDTVRRQLGKRQLGELPGRHGGPLAQPAITAVQTNQCRCLVRLVIATSMSNAICAVCPKSRNDTVPHRPRQAVLPP